MKREPGAIPGQSRCCEAPQNSEHLSHWPRAGKASEQEPVRRPAKSIRHRTRPWDGRSISEVFHQDEELTRRCAPFRPADTVAGIRLPHRRTRPTAGQEVGQEGRKEGPTEGRTEGQAGGRIISGRPRTADKGALQKEGCTAGKRPATGALRRRGLRTGSGSVRHKASEAARARRGKGSDAADALRHGTSSRSGKSSLHGRNGPAQAPVTARVSGATRAPCPWKTSGRTPGSASGNRSQRSYPSHP